MANPFGIQFHLFTHRIDWVHVGSLEKLQEEKVNVVKGRIALFYHVRKGFEQNLGLVIAKAVVGLVKSKVPEKEIV